MGNPFFYLVMFCVANPAIIAARPTSDEQRDSKTNKTSGADENEIASSDSRVYRLKSVMPFVEPPWKKPHFVVDNNTREIFIPSGAPFKETGPAQDMFQKYFSGCTLGNFTFTGNGFAHFSNATRAKDQFELVIDPLQPGSYEFEYEGFRQAQTITNVWTVHALGSLTIRNNAFFELVQNLTRHEVTDATEIRDSQRVGIKKRKDRKSLLVYGLADELKNGTILDITGQSKTRPIGTLTKIRLLLEKPPSHSKVDHIEVWIEDFEETISNKRKIARCVAAQYGASYLELEEVLFDHGTGKTVFTAQLPNRDTCEQLGNIKQRISECPFKVQALRLTCASGESRSGPQGFFTTRDSSGPTGSSPSEVSGPNGSSPSKDSGPRGSSPSKDSGPTGTSPSDDSGPTGISPPDDSGPTGISPSNDPGASGSSSSKGSDSRGLSPPEDSGPIGSSPSKDSGSRGDSPSKDSRPTSSSPTEGSSKGSGSGGTSPPNDSGPIGSSPSKDSGSRGDSPSEDSSPTGSSPTEPSARSPSKDSGSKGKSSSKDSNRADDSSSEDSTKQTIPRFSKADFSSFGGRDRPANDGRDKPANDGQLSWFWELLNWVAVFSVTFVIICITICLWELFHRFFCPTCIV